MFVLNDMCLIIIIPLCSPKEFSGERALRLRTPRLSSTAPRGPTVLRLRVESILRARCHLSPPLLVVPRKPIGIPVWLYFYRRLDRGSHRNLWCILTTPHFVIEWRVSWNTCHALQMISDRRHSHQQLWCAPLRLSSWWNPILEAPPQGPIRLRKQQVLRIVEVQYLKFPNRAGQLQQPNCKWKEGRVSIAGKGPSWLVDN